MKVFPARPLDLMFKVELIKDVGRKFLLSTFFRNQTRFLKLPKAPWTN